MGQADLAEVPEGFEQVVAEREKSESQTIVQQATTWWENLRYILVAALLKNGDSIVQDDGKGEDKQDWWIQQRETKTWVNPKNSGTKSTMLFTSINL